MQKMQSNHHTTHHYNRISHLFIPPKKNEFGQYTALPPSIPRLEIKLLQSTLTESVTLAYRIEQPRYQHHALANTAQSLDTAVKS
jgi:hypothetical protein